MNKLGTVIVACVAVAALVVGLSARSAVTKGIGRSLADTVLERSSIRVGYIVYPPLLFKDPSTGALSGVSYDLVEAAAKKLNLKAEWVEEVGWGTANEGLKTGRYDILGTQMWPNSARAREVAFSVAPMKSVLYPYVRSDDHRIDDDLARLNSDQFTVSAVDGELATFIAAEDYPMAKTNTLPQLSSYAEVFMNIVEKKGDVSFAEPSAANDFLKTNPDSIRKAIETPVRTFGNSFAFPHEQESMVSMWNVALGELMNDGTVARTLSKYGVSADYVLSK